MIFWRALEILWAITWLGLMGYAVWRLWVGRRMAKALRARMQAGEAERIKHMSEWAKKRAEEWRPKPKPKGDEKC